MSLPAKNYFYLQELIERWGIPGIDLRYFAEQGELEIQTWLDETMVIISRATRTEDGVAGTVQIGVSTYKRRSQAKINITLPRVAGNIGYGKATVVPIMYSGQMRDPDFRLKHGNF